MASTVLTGSEMPTLKSVACADAATVSAPKSAIAPARFCIVLAPLIFLPASSRTSRVRVVVPLLEGARSKRASRGDNGRETARQGRDRERGRLRRAGLGQRPRHGGDLC